MNETINSLATTVYKILKSDRDVLICVGGFTGEGKSCFLTKLQKEYGEISGIKWDFSNMTWSRKELLQWIDGEENSKKDEETNLKKGQKEEYTAIMSDELFSMFYRRNWYDSGQISAITTFNMCRDRHLFVGGNVPDFWDLDSSFQKRVRFYVYVAERGIAWLFQQENNPFSNDTWNVNENKKLFRKYHKPYKCKNFVCEIKFSDWSSKEKEEYYKIRNVKRMIAIKESQKDKIERYKDIKEQRDKTIRLYLTERKNISNELKKSKPNLINFKKMISYKDLSEVINLGKEAIRLIYEGLR